MTALKRPEDGEQCEILYGEEGESKLFYNYQSISLYNIFVQNLFMIFLWN